ncbi:diguanylate cyclase (GGDEF) domain-containing protein [Epsilonproteobacteria bacterium SCGC AD-308-O04]|nr:diguanylate cyclase (GGDEF) domain-containing protein [Epsilonproteobacteria bacterium SCGC AD-308-O04]
MVFILLSIAALILTKQYLEQREETSFIISKTLQDDMAELTYILSKNITKDATIRSSHAILDRATLTNDYIAVILVLDDNDILITTDPHYNTIPSMEEIYHDETLSFYDRLLFKKGIEGYIRFYQGETLHQLKLIFIFDHDEIEKHFQKSRSNFVIYFGLLPILILFSSLIIIRYVISLPLEKLRQFAYYQTSIPKAFKLKELEAIRSSMVQTFSRLDEEQKELYKMARTDRLSGLANRNALNEYLERLIADSLHANQEFAFLFLDIDHFKAINDELGNPIGDELLKKVSAKIKAVLPSNDFVARVGGDEFVIVLHQYETLTELTTIVDRIQQSIQDQWIIENNPINISSSVGIALYPKDGVEVTSLIQHSNIAMYEAKKKGRAQYYFFTDDLNTKVQDTIALDKAMRQALEDDEYELYYQPKTDVQTGAIEGVEALIRWISPTHGVISPAIFIPLAEENGFIVKLGDWVLQEAIYQQIKWKEKGLDIQISINVATKQLLDSNFEYKFTNLLQESRVDVSKIKIEITEYLFLEHNNKNLHVLHFIHDKGIEISLDDFGTGYSSLSYLKKFPIDTLKIDKIFMDDYNTPEGAIFLETIVKMGQTLNMKVIAEGVESKEQVEYLKSIDCNTYQGFYCSKPLPVKDFELFYTTYDI